MARARKPPTPTETIPALPRRAEATHKGQVGRVAIVAGSRGMSGAAVLSGLGALRGGAGLVRIFTPVSVQQIVAASEPCLMVTPLGEDDEGRLERAACEGIDASWPTVLAIGPGLGRSADVRNVIAGLLRAFDGACVIDADGLNNIAEGEIGAWDWGGASRIVVTPHPGEMARLRAAAGLSKRDGDDDATRLKTAHEFAALTGVTVVLKGHRTVVCTGEHAYVNTTGNPGMASGGMGDVLTGLIAALLGQGLDTFDAARLGVYLHGAAGDRAARSIGPVGYLARDVAALLPAALAETVESGIGFHNR